MAEFDPEPPPLVLPPAPPVLSPTIPLNPPMVGEASPWIHVDGENRDLILESIRAWVRQTLLPWTSRWQTQLTDWEGDAATQLNEWLTLADTYITGHAIAGLSFRTTETPIAGAGTTNVTLVTNPTTRPIALGDLVLDSTPDGNYGIVTVIIDDTHATVSYIGSLLGPNGLSFRSTASTIAGAGTSDIVIPVTPNYPPILGDLVADQTSGNFGQITVITDPTHVTVTYLGTFKGPKGDKGDKGDTGDPGTNGTNGTDGIMSSVVAGANVFVDSTDPANPVVSAVGAWTFTDPATMNATWAGDGNPVHPSNGDIGVLAASITPGIFTQCIFVYNEDLDAWSNPQVTLSNNNPTETFTPTDNWDNFVTYMSLGAHTRLNFTGATFVETINNSHPVWNEAVQQIRPDKTQLRPGIVSAQTPGGSVVKNDDCSYTLTACTNMEIDRWFPTLTRDGSDEVLIKLSGVMSANGYIAARLSQYNNGPDASASYGSYGRTLNYTSAPTLGYDTDEATAGPTATQWSIVSDTTNAPTVVEATLEIKNIASSVAAIAKMHSIYRTPDFSQVYERDFTLFNVLNVGGANPFRLPDGLELIFEHAFTGTIRLVSEF